MMNLKKIPWGFLLKMGLAVGLFWYLIGTGKLDFKVLLEASHPEYLLVAVVLLITSVLFNNLRWTLLLRKSGIDCEYTRTLKLTLMGLFFNFTLPSSVGGDLVKAYYLAKENNKKKIIVGTSVLVDRITGLYVMVGLAAGTMLLNIDRIKEIPMLTGMIVPVVLVFLGMSVFFVMAFSKRLNQWHLVDRIFDKIPNLFKRVYEAFHGFGRSKGTFVVALCLSMGSQLMAVGFMFVFALSIDVTDFPLSAFFFAVPVGFIAMSLPIAPAGLGIGQVAFLTLFNIYTGVDSQVGPLGITAFQVFSFLLGIIGAFFYLQEKREIQGREVPA